MLVPSHVRRQVRRAAAAVELAVLLPFLMTMIVALWEIGRMVEVQQLLNNAAREGARQAATGIKTESDVVTFVVNYLKSNGIPTISASNIVLQNLDQPGIDPTTAKQLDRLKITITIAAKDVRWVTLGSLTPDRTLGSTATWYSMRDIPLTVDKNIPL